MFLLIPQSKIFRINNKRCSRLPNTAGRSHTLHTRHDVGIVALFLKFCCAEHGRYARPESSLDYTQWSNNTIPCTVPYYSMVTAFCKRRRRMSNGRLSHSAKEHRCKRRIIVLITSRLSSTAGFLSRRHLHRNLLASECKMRMFNASHNCKGNSSKQVARLSPNLQEVSN